ncbi:MAG: Serine threonine rich antigen [Candidatus Uhrbacteria bacterium GW2011_GWC2_40_450]|nr:MAG: Serine threonine rich antigen [Candidatus Uhrbacteria bacterium GW2011_GWC2_40_450]
MLDGLTISSQTYLVIESPKGKLNNDGDTVSLFDPAGNLINSMSYGTDELDNPNKGESLVWNGSSWAITSDITKSTANQASYEDQTNESGTESNTESDQESTSTTTSGTSNTGNNSQSQYTPVSNNQPTSSGNDSSVSDQLEAHRVVAIAESPSKTTTTKSSSSSTKSSTAKSSAISKVSGIVTAVPGTFGSQIAFIEGMQLYFYYADWPMLEVGDIVTVSGELSESRGEQRIKISDMRDIEVTGHAESDAQSSSIFDLKNEKDGTLITVEGTVGTIQDTKLNLFDGTGSIVVVANTHEGMNWNTAGTQLRVTGVLRTVSGEQRLYPRTMQDVTDMTPVAQSSESSQTIAVGQAKDYTPWVGGGLLATALAGFAYFFVRRSRLETAPMGA